MELSANKANILLFDGVCNFCNSTVVFILQRDIKERIYFASLQSGIGHQLLKKYQLPISDNPQSAVFIKNGKVFLKSRAAIEVLKTVGGLYSMAFLLCLVPPFLRDKIYDFISKNRYKWFGKKNKCMIPNEQMKKRFLE